jgi:hypothetical protein
MVYMRQGIRAVIEVRMMFPRTPTIAPSYAHRPKWLASSLSLNPRARLLLAILGFRAQAGAVNK